MGKQNRDEFELFDRTGHNKDGASVCAYRVNGAWCDGESEQRIGRRAVWLLGMTTGDERFDLVSLKSATLLGGAL